MRLTAKPSCELSALIAAEIAGAERAVTRGVAAAGAGLQTTLRQQITGSGLGERLARTIRRKVFPEAGVSIRAATLVWSKAPKLVDAFDRGVLIRSKDGFYLAIPLPAPGAKGPGNTRITPGGWEQRTGRRLRFVYRRGAPSLLVADDARIDARGRATAKRGRRRRDGILTGAQTVPVFLLVPQVRLKKRIDIDGAAAAWQPRLPGLILAHWSETPDRG